MEAGIFLGRGTIEGGFARCYLIQEGVKVEGGGVFDLHSNK